MAKKNIKTKTPQKPAAGTPKHGRHPIWALAFVLLMLGILAALISYDKSQYAWAPDDWLNDTRGGSQNLTGIVGATLSVWSFHLFGVAAWLLPVFFGLMAMYMLRLRENFSLYWKSFEMVLVLILVTIFLCAIPEDCIGYDKSARLACMPKGPGGLLGGCLFELAAPYFGAGTIAIVAAVIYIPLFCSLCLTSLTRILGKLFHWFYGEFDYWSKRHAEKVAKLELEREVERQKALDEAQRRREEQNFYGSEENAPTADDVVWNNVPETAETPENDVPAESAVPAPTITISGVPANDEVENEAVPAEPKNIPAPAAIAGTLVIDNGENVAPATINDAGTLERASASELKNPRGEYKFPPLDLLQKPAKYDDVSEAEHLERGQKIIEILETFDCHATLANIQVGPTVTRYEIRLAPGLNVNKVVNLGDNIAMGICALSARVKPIPQNGTVGIEVPNVKRQMVYIREILESKSWVENKKMSVPTVLGKNVTGQSVLLDIAKMPHGLIAGTSGSGKSVCLNGIIVSLLYRLRPDELRMIMVDPKVVELQVYNNVPHMMIPVITDIKRVPGALKYLVDEMERRYRLLAISRTKNIQGFNEKIEELQKSVPAESQTFGVPRDEGVEDEFTARKKLPYILCIIDEFGDIMNSSQERAEVENGVNRLAAKSRAAGIHVLIATQRPDAKTITGTIKSNIGTRIALRVTSALNSNIILGESGAETLIGLGDMLVLNPNSPELERAQGVWVSETEVEKVVNFLKDKNGPPKFSDDVTAIIDGYTEEAEGNSGGNADESGLSGDELLACKAWDIIWTTKRASTSYLQMRLRVGYGVATRIITALEANGYIGPAVGPKAAREILKDHWDGIDMDKAF